MNLRSFITFMAAAMFVVVSCGKENPDNGGPAIGGNGDTRDEAINGTTIDENSNAAGLVYDATTNKGIAGVPVTDGYTYTVTDANGVYQMAANRYCRNIYISLPSEYKVPLDPATKSPAFYSTKAFNKSKYNRNDFALEPQESEKNWTFIAVGDPQCQKTADVDRYMKETIPDMQAFVYNGRVEGRYKGVYAVTLGDITHDSYTTWDGMKTSMSNVKLQDGTYLPFFQCIGNHDHNSLVTSNDYEATAKYVEEFGPTDYSFNRGDVHVVVMDDIMVTSTTTNGSPNKATWGYNGGFTKAQYNWLQQDLAQVKDQANKMVFICLHIPFRGGSASGGSNVNKTAYYAEILSLLKNFHEAHIMIGHTHYPQNWIHSGYVCKGGQPIYEHVHGAACGAWWNSNSNVTGAPNGYSVYDIQGNTVTNWVAKGTNHGTDYQLRVYDGNQIYTGTKGYEYSWYNTANKVGSFTFSAVGNASFKNALIAEVWDDDAANWKVEMYKDGAKVGDFKRITDGGSANIAIVSYYFNEKGKTTDTWVNKTASHYWYWVPSGKTPAEYAAQKGWEVKATQTIPTSKKVNVYYGNSLTTDYSEF